MLTREIARKVRVKKEQLKDVRVIFNLSKEVNGNTYDIYKYM